MIFSYSSDSGSDSSVIYNKEYKDDSSSFFTNSKSNSYSNSKNNSYKSENYIYKIKEENKIKTFEKKNSKLKYKFVLQELKYNETINDVKNLLYKRTYDLVLKELIIRILKPPATIYLGILKSLEGSHRKNKILMQNYKPPEPPENYPKDFLLSVKNQIDKYEKKGLIDIVKKLEKYYNPYFEKNDMV